MMKMGQANSHGQALYENLFTTSPSGLRLSSTAKEEAPDIGASSGDYNTTSYFLAVWGVTAAVAFSIAAFTASPLSFTAFFTVSS